MRFPNPCSEIHLAILILRRNYLDCKLTVLPGKKLCVDELAEKKGR
jgi:hypothetical protein